MSPDRWDDTTATTVRVVHLVQQLSRGGAGQALLSLIGTTAATTQHTMVSLVAPDAVTTTAVGRTPLVSAPSDTQLLGLVESADIVQIHFWNTPELYAAMALPWGPSRVVVWAHVNGSTAPHVLTPAVRDFADRVVTTSVTGALPDDQVIPGRSRWRFPSRAATVPGSSPFTVGIFGTLSATRWDPAAIEIFARCPADARLLVVGDGDLCLPWQAAATARGFDDRVEFAGRVDDITAPLSRMDVSLHLPAAGSSVTTDLALQECMAAGAVPIVLAGTPLAEVVRHQVDSIVADSIDGCVAAIDSLYRDPELTRRIRRQGQLRAADEFSPMGTARAFDRLYRDLMGRPRRPRTLALPPSGAERFINALGSCAAPFESSLARDGDSCDSDTAIEASSAVMAGPGAGGILHYRGYYPADPALRYWAGLVFRGQGRQALAAADFAFAARAGFPAAAEQLASVLDGAGRGTARTTTAVVHL